MEKRKDIYSGLKSHHGALSRLAKEAGVSTRWVTMVLAGEAEDDALVVKAAELWLALERERATARERAAVIADEASMIAQLAA